VNNSILIIIVLNQITLTKGGIKNTVKTILLNMFYKKLINRYCTKLATKCYRTEKSSLQYLKSLAIYNETLVYFFIFVNIYIHILHKSI